MNEEMMWEKCVSFHGHVCGGLTIGFKAALYAAEQLRLSFSKDEEIVCIAENDACGVDAIQVMLGCSVGKGNLLFHITGKQAFSFYNRQTGESLRLVLNPRPQNISREESAAYYRSLESRQMFTVKETVIPLPERAPRFDSFVCEECGETAGTRWLRMEGGRRLCVDCCRLTDRFHV